MAESPAADPIQRAHESINQTIGDIGGVVDSVAERIRGIVNDTLRAIFDPLGAALTAQLQVFGDLTTGLLQNLATPEEIVAATIQAWSQSNYNGEPLSTSLAGWIADSVTDSFGKYVAAHVNLEVDPAWKVGERDGSNPPPISGYKERLDELPGVLKAIHNLAAAVMVIGAYAQAEHSANLSALQQAVAMSNPVTPLGAAELAQAVIQSQVPQDWAAHEVKRLGLTDELFDLMVKVGGNPPGLQPILELWRRGVITEEQVNQAIAESSLKNKYIEPIKKLATVLPSPSDLIRFLVRDALDDSVAQSLQLDEGFAQKYKADLFFQVGLDEQLAKYYWRSHWQLPSPGQMYEMLHRTSDEQTQWSQPVTLPSGKTVYTLLSQEQLKNTLKIDDHLIPFLDKYIAISYNPPARVDARRMYMSGVFDDDALYRAFLDEGYAPAFCSQMLQWMKAAKLDAQHKQAEQHTRPIVHAMQGMYQRGLLGAGEYKQQAIALGYDPDEIEVQLQVLDMGRANDRASKIRDDLHRLFTQGFISEEEAGARLQAEGFTVAEWARLRDDWRIDVEFRERSDEQKAARALTRQQIIEAYRDHLLSRDDVSTRLKDMGYVDDEITLWLALADYQEQQKLARVEQEAVHSDYVDEVINEDAARSQLHEIGIAGDQADALIRRWSAERRRRDPKLNVGQIENAFKHAIIDVDRAKSMLTDLRYSPDEQAVLIGIWEQDVSVAQGKLELERQIFEERQREFATRQTATEQRAEQSRAFTQAQQSRQQAFAQAQQARQLEAQTQRAAAGFEAAAKRQATAVAAASARQDKSLEAARQREQAQLDIRNKALAQARDLAQQAREATDARQQRQLQAQADRQQASFDQQDKIYQQRVQDRIAEELRSQQFQIAKEQRQQTYEQAKEQRVNALKIQGELRSNRRELEKELRTQGFAVAREQRQSAAKIAQEQRVAERNAALASATAQAESVVSDLRLKQQSTASKSAADIMAEIEQQVQAQISSLPTGQ